MTAFDFWLAVAVLIGGGVATVGGIILRGRYKRRDK